MVSLSDSVRAVPRLLAVPGVVLPIRFRCFRGLSVVAALLSDGGREPLTDVMALELASGSGSNPDWPRPVTLSAVVDSGQDAARTVRRVSQWASYSSRVAVAPASRVDDEARAEAQLRGVWLLAADTEPWVAVPGQCGPYPGCERGLLHRLFDEHILAALLAAERAG